MSAMSVLFTTDKWLQAHPNTELNEECFRFGSDIDYRTMGRFKAQFVMLDSNEEKLLPYVVEFAKELLKVFPSAIHIGVAGKLSCVRFVPDTRILYDQLGVFTMENGNVVTR